MDNSWTLQWGISGRAYITFDDLGTLLADDGDCTVFVPLSAGTDADSNARSAGANTYADQKDLKVQFTDR
jgi:hypothetical protein